MSDFKKLTGPILLIEDTQQISDKFQKREFVVTDNENPQYPQPIKFEATQDKCSMLDGYKKGQVVTVFYNLRGREWTNKQGVTSYFNTVQAWKIEPAGQEQPAYQPPAVQQAAGNTNDDEDSLPF